MATGCWQLLKGQPHSTLKSLTQVMERQQKHHLCVSHIICINSCNITVYFKQYPPPFVNFYYVQSNFKCFTSIKYFTNFINEKQGLIS